MLERGIMMNRGSFQLMNNEDVTAWNYDEQRFIPINEQMKMLQRGIIMNRGSF